MGIPLLAGREFTARDTADAPKVAIVSERIVREYVPGGPTEALGRRGRLDDRGGGGAVGRVEIRRAAPDLPIVGTLTMDEAVAASVAQPRFRMLLLGLFAVAATLIATCGLYGLMASAVTPRRRS